MLQRMFDLLELLVGHQFVRFNAQAAASVQNSLGILLFFKIASQLIEKLYEKDTRELKKRLNHFYVAQIKLQHKLITKT